jgi:hypothetical protein
VQPMGLNAEGWATARSCAGRRAARRSGVLERGLRRVPAAVCFPMPLFDRDFLLKIEYKCTK